MEEDADKRQRQLDTQTGLLEQRKQRLETELATVEANKKKAEQKLAEIEQTIEKRSKKQADELQSKFILKWGAWVYVLGAYGFFVIFLEAFEQEAFKRHFKAFWGAIWTFIDNNAINLDKWATELSRGIQNDIGATVVHLLLAYGIPIVILLAIAVLIMLWAIWFIKNQADKVSFIYALFSFTLIVYNSYWLYYHCKVNMFLLWLLGFILYQLIRLALTYEYQDKYQNSVTLGTQILHALHLRKSPYLYR